MGVWLHVDEVGFEGVVAEAQEEIEKEGDSDELGKEPRGQSQGSCDHHTSNSKNVDNNVEQQ